MYTNYRKEQLLNEIADRVVDILYEKYEHGRLDEASLKDLVKKARNFTAGAALALAPFIAGGQSLVQGQNMTKDFTQPTYMSTDVVGSRDMQRSGKADYNVSQGLRQFSPAASSSRTMASSPWRGAPSGWIPVVNISSALLNNLRSINRLDTDDREGLYQTYLNMYYNPDEHNNLSNLHTTQAFVEEIRTFPERFEISVEGLIDLAAGPGHDTRGAIDVSQIKLRMVDSTYGKRISERRMLRLSRRF